MEQRKDQQEKKSKKISRRSFLKTSGVAGLTVGAAVAAGGVSNPKSVLAGEETGRPIVDLVVNEAEKPSYLNYPFADGEKLERFDERSTAFNNKKLCIENYDGKHWYAALNETIMSILKSNEHVHGNSIIDQSISDAAWGNYRAANELSFSWEPIGLSHLYRFEEIDKWDGLPEENNKIIKKTATLFGAGQTGVTEVNEQWFYSHSETGEKIVFSDEHKKPLKTEEAHYIPKSMKTLIVMLIPMDQETMLYPPSAMGHGGVGVAYSQLAETSMKMAEFIRGIGYNAIPMGNDTGLSVPMAIDAGLGELGRHGLLINPLYGSWFRLCKVLTDLPATYDRPIEFGASKFCRSCMKCAETCPSQSITYDKDPSTKVYCESNNPGMKKWYVNAWNCLDFYVKNGTPCNVCIAVCVYNKPQTWIHDVVKGISAVTPVFNGTFKVLDDTLGYGKIKDEDPWEWWGI